MPYNDHDLKPIQVGLAVGTTEKDTENATFTNIKLRVRLTLANKYPQIKTSDK